MIKAKNLPGIFCGEVVNCLVYLLNRTTSRGTGGKTPYELWTGSKPNLKKLEDRARQWCLWDESESTGYMCYDLVTRKFHISRDVVFNEEASWDWSGVMEDGVDSEFIIESETEVVPTVVTEARFQQIPVDRCAGDLEQVSS
jgi:hypothetical protein